MFSQIISQLEGITANTHTHETSPVGLKRLITLVSDQKRTFPEVSAKKYLQKF